MRIITCGRKQRGTCHADDLSYLFYNAGAKKLKYRTAEYTTIRRMVAILVKFSECGDPNIPLTDAVCWPALNGCCSNGHDKQQILKEKQQQLQVEVQLKDNEKIDNDDTLNGSGSNSNSSSNPSGSDEHEHDDDDDEPDVSAGICVNNDGNINLLLQQDEHHKQQLLLQQYWPPITCTDDDGTTFKCLNISDELEVIDLPEAEKLKLWDSMYEDKSLLY